MKDPREQFVREQMQALEQKLLSGIPHVMRALHDTVGYAKGDQRSEVKRMIEVLSAVAQRQSITRLNAEPDTFQIDADLAWAMEAAIEYLEFKRPLLKPTMLPFLFMSVPFSAQMRLQIQQQINATEHDRRAHGLLVEQLQLMNSVGNGLTIAVRNAKKESLKNIELWLTTSPEEYDRLLAPRIAYVAKHLP